MITLGFNNLFLYEIVFLFGRRYSWGWLFFCFWYFHP